MPFLGLVDPHGIEIKASGYHRIDLSQFPFKISPPNDPTIHFVFINQIAIMWPAAKGKWPDVSGCCVFAEIDDEKPVIVRMFPGPARRLLAGEILSMGPGQLRLDQTVTPNERRNYKMRKCPKCGAEVE